MVISEPVLSTKFYRSHHRLQKFRLVVFPHSPVGSLSVVDGNIDLNTSFDGDAGDLLDDIGRSVQIDQALVDAHFETIPGVRTLSGRSLTGGDAKLLGRHTDGSADVKLLVEGGLLQVRTDLFEVLDVAAGKGDADAVDNGVLRGGSGFLLESRHGGMLKKIENASD